MRFEGDPLWTVLLDALRSIAQVEDREPYGLVVTAERPNSTPSVVEIVMTPDQWNDLVDIMWGAVEPAAQHARQLVLDHPSDQRYLVHRLYELVPCPTPEIPANPAFRRLQELAAQHPDGVIPGGRWSAHAPDNDPPA